MKSAHLPQIITNFKNYPTATGAAAEALATTHARVAAGTGARLAVAVAALDVRLVSAVGGVAVWAQHADAASPGASTGHLVPQLLREAGAVGVLLNHSEHRFESTEELAKAAAACGKAGLMRCICAESAQEAARLATRCEAEMFAIEPPELIGGDVSVSSAQPELIANAVERLPNMAVMVGAGIKTQADVAVARRLGAHGVLLASGITKASNPESVLRELVAGLER